MTNFEGSFGIWQKFETTLAKVGSYWVHFHQYEWPIIEEIYKLSGHSVYDKALGEQLTRIFEPEMRFRFRMFFEQDRLRDVLGQDLVEDVVRRHRQRLLALQQLLDQQRVQVVRVHDVVFASES